MLIKEGEKERAQAFEGVVIKKTRGGARASFTVRKVSYGVGVERVFPLHTPRIEKIEVIARGRVRRARLYYLRDLAGKAARIKEKAGISAALVAPSRPTPTQLPPQYLVAHCPAPPAPRAEQLAADYLAAAGFASSSATSPVKGGEIDLVCDDAGTLVFVEVRARSDARPRHARRDDRRDASAAASSAPRGTTSGAQLDDRACRFDVVAIEGTTVRHFADAFQS